MQESKGQRTLLTFRLIKAFDKAKLLDKMTYKRVMAVLRHAKIVKIGASDWRMVRCNPSHISIMQELGVIPKQQEQEKRKSGKPKKTTV